MYVLLYYIFHWMPPEYIFYSLHLSLIKKKINLLNTHCHSLSNDYFLAHFYIYIKKKKNFLLFDNSCVQFQQCCGLPWYV